MSLAEFNALVVPILNLGFSAIAALSIILLYVQIRQTNRWNQLQSRFNFIEVTDSSEINREMVRLFERLKIHELPPEQQTPFSKEVLDKIDASGHESTFIVDMFLNELQNMCASLRFGLVDKKVFDAVHSGRILFWYRRLSSYAERKKAVYDDPHLWADFLSVGAEIEKERKVIRQSTVRAIKNTRSHKRALANQGRRPTQGLNRTPDGAA